MGKAELRRLEAALRLVGATDVSATKGKHVKVKFSNAGQQAMVVLSATPSDHRAKKNQVATIRRELNRIGITDQRFDAWAVLGPIEQVANNAAIWNLLDEWEQAEDQETTHSS